MKRLSIVLILIVLAGLAQAKVDLVTLPSRDTVQLTIYNSADMTLVRESRGLTLKKGANSLQFSWENTLIDPTSLEMTPKANADKIDVADLVFPPRVKNVGIWDINSALSDKVPVQITYLTSGLSWRAFYMGTLSKDEKVMRLQGYVRVTNNSGEDYENAQTRLIVGRVHILDQIAALARRDYPYGRPGAGPQAATAAPMGERGGGRGGRGGAGGMGGGGFGGMAAFDAVERPKEVAKEGLSEYFLYTIEGTETITTGWSKRLQSFDVNSIPVVNLYKYEEEKYGRNVVRFLSFKNDTEHKLGQTPIPDGLMRVYRGVDDQKHLSYEGRSSFKYIPVNEDVELNFGGVRDVVVEPRLMDYKTDNYRYSSVRNIEGWDEIRTFKVEVRNTRDVAVKIEIRRNFDSAAWEIRQPAQSQPYEKVDLDTVKFTLQLEPRSKKTFEYTLTSFRGTRAQDFESRNRQ
jgi:hypothetical protein